MQLIRKIFSIQDLLNPNHIKGNIPSDKSAYKRVFDIAWPSAVEAVLIALIGAMDTIMVGSLGKEAISAVGICNQPKYLCLAVIFAINTGTVVMVSRRKGQGQQQEAIDYAKIGIVLSALASLICCLLSFFFSREILLFAGANNDYIDLAVDYYKIVTLSLIPYSIGLTMTSAHRGAGFTKISMITNLIANGVNIIFNAILINGLFGFPRLEVTGAAIATAMGNVLSFIIAFVSVLSKKNYIRINFKKIEDYVFKIKTFISIAYNAFIEQIILRFGFFIFAKIVAGLGTVEFAAHQAVQNIMTISFSFGDGLQIANTSLVGQSIGEKRDDLAEIYTYVTQRIGNVISIILFILVSFNSDLLMRVFISDIDVIAAGRIPMFILGTIILFQIPQVILFGALRGAGDLKFVTRVMIICVAGIRTICPYLLAYTFNLGLIGAWIGTLIDQFARFFCGLSRFKSRKWAGINF